MPKLIPEETKAKIARDYVNDPEPVPAVLAQRYGVSIDSVYKIVNERNLRQARELRVLSPTIVKDGLLQNAQFLVQQANAENRPLSPKELDSLSKLNKIVLTIDPKSHSLAIQFDTIDELRSFIDTEFPDLSEQMVPVFIAFAQRLAGRVSR